MSLLTIERPSVSSANPCAMLKLNRLAGASGMK